MIGFLSHFSPFSAAILFVVVFVAISLACLCIVKRFCKSLLFNQVTDYGQIFARKYLRRIKHDGAGNLRNLRKGL